MSSEEISRSTEESFEERQKKQYDKEKQRKLLLSQNSVKPLRTPKRPAVISSFSADSFGESSIEEMQRKQYERERLRRQSTSFQPAPHVADSQAAKLQAKLKDSLLRLLITMIEELEVEPEFFAEGTFGTVHRGKYHGKQVAVKKLKMNGSPGEVDLLMKELKKELKLWSRLTHSNIVQLQGYTEPPLAPMIVMELMEGSLFDVLQNKRVKLSLVRRVEMAHGLASGISYLHSKEGVHRDIKSLNVLVKREEVKLADFGGTRKLSSLRTATKGGSIRWNAPEVLKEEKFSQASDVYAMGITFSEILTREIPYAHLKADEDVTLAVRFGTRPQLWPPTEGMQELLGDLEQQTEGFRQLFQKCWDEHPERRPSAREVRLKLADLLSQLQHLAPSTVGAASSSSSEPVKSIPMPLYTFGSSK